MSANSAASPEWAEKTRLIEFGRFAAQDGKKRGEKSRRPLRSWASRTTAGSAGAMGRPTSGGNGEEVHGGQAAHT